MNYKVELGSLGYKKSSYNLIEEYLPELTGLRGIETYKKMRTSDPLLNGFFRAFTSIVKSANFYLNTNSSYTESDILATDIINRSLFDMDSQTFKDFVATALDQAATYGFAVFEIILKDEDDITKVSKLALRPANSIAEFVLDDKGDIVGIRQNTEKGEVFIPHKKLLIISFDKSQGIEVGYSLLRGAYKPYYYASHLEDLEAILIERESTGLPLIQVPPELLRPNASEAEVSVLQSIIEQAEAVRVDERAAVIMPSESYTDATGTDKKTGYKFELIRSGGSRAIKIDEVIRRYQQAMLISLLSEFLLLGGSGGSYALSESKNSLFLLCVEGMLSQIVEQMDHKLIPLLMKLNGLSLDSMPTLAFDSLHRESLQTMTNFLTNMVQNGILNANDPNVKNLALELGGIGESLAEEVTEEGQ